MKNKIIHNLNLFENTLLDGISLIEASAGTGKTWNICMLYLRLLLEKKLHVSEILVVTFTNAATAELKGRIRERLTETLLLLEDNLLAADPILIQLIEYLEKRKVATRQEMYKQLKLAISHFDEASISTIHGFCQKVIGLRAFETGQPFSFTNDKKEKDIVNQVVHDFWRKNIASQTVDKTLGQYLHLKNITPEKLSLFLEREINKPLAEKRWPNDMPPLNQNKLKNIKPIYDSMKECWQKNQETIIDTLFDAIKNKVLNGNKYRKTTLEKSVETVHHFFEQDDPAGFLLVGNLNHIENFSFGKLNNSLNKNQSVPRHEFFSLTQKWIDLRDELFQTLELTYLHLLFILSKEVEEVRIRNKRNRILSFNGMLYNLYDALKETHSDDLKTAIRSLWKAALIDEFQDTDPIQFFIFYTIYGNDKNASVFFVGDPKQAIYRFRNADLHTYFEARKKVDSQYSLTTNYRATPEVINACNVLFSFNKKAFIHHELIYPLVQAADKEREILFDPKIPTDKTTSGMVVWYLPGNEDQSFLPRKDAISASANATANEIVRLLKTVQLSNKKLEAGDIAILVRTHNEAKIIQEVLSSYGLPSSTLSPGNIWLTPEANELITIFSAIINPRNQAHLRAALSTEILGFNAIEIEQLENDSEKQLVEIEKFLEYRTDWIKHGISFVIRQLMSDNHSYTKILSLPNGERHLTNILHLSELISEAAETYSLPESLLNWMIEQQEISDPDENAQIRMESDENLIRIMTIHVAKGKEFKFVFCPFLWNIQNSNPKNSSKKSEIPGIEYQETNWVIDFQIHDEIKKNEIKRNILIEDVSEKIRLIYVALTRAIYRCYVIAGTYNPVRNSDGGISNPLNWFVNHDNNTYTDWLETNKNTQILEINWQTLANNCENIYLQKLPVEKKQEFLSEKIDTHNLISTSLDIANWPEKIPSGWHISSYSNLVHGAKHESSGNDYDEQVKNEPLYDESEVTLPQNDFFLFPANRYAGNCLHAIFEDIDFTDESNWDNVIKEKLQRHPPYGRINPINGIPQEELHLMIKKMLHDVLSTELPNGITLNQIKSQNRLSELEFFLPTQHLTSNQLEKILTNDYFSPSYSFQPFQGYIKGLIDLVIEYENRFYILDWKSNFLGTHPSDYEQNKLLLAIKEHHYYLQYLFYSTALHRHLKHTKPDYQYDIHFGGVLYLFIRGIRPSWKMQNNTPCGVFYRSAKELYPDIKKLDELISQGTLK